MFRTPGVIYIARIVTYMRAPRSLKFAGILDKRQGRGMQRGIRCYAECVIRFLPWDRIESAHAHEQDTFALCLVIVLLSAFEDEPWFPSDVRIMCSGAHAGANYAKSVRNIKLSK